MSFEQRKARASPRNTPSVEQVQSDYECLTPAWNGNLNGYSGAKSLCQTACLGSATAHMCTSEAMIRNSALGIAVPYPSPGIGGWVSSGVASEVGSGSGILSDCQGLDDHRVWHIRRRLGILGGQLRQLQSNHNATSGLL